MKRSYEAVVCTDQPPTLSVNFACFVTCLYKNQSSTHSGDLILGMNIPGFNLPCILLAEHNNHALEIYMECDGLPLTLLMRYLERLGMCCIGINTFGKTPLTNGAPEALARIKYRVTSCGFTGHFKGVPKVIETLDYDFRDEMTNWISFTVDQIPKFIRSSASKPAEVVEWCVVVCSGDTSALETRLKALSLRMSRQYYVKGYVCTCTSMLAMIYLEVEPIVKTVLFRCLISELVIPEEILTFDPDQQAFALSLVSRLKCSLIEGGNLSEVNAASVRVGDITKFTKRDCAVWECVVVEPAPKYWFVQERDNELVRLKMQISTLQTEKRIVEDEAIYYGNRCARLVGALEEMNQERDRLHGDVSWSEWEKMRCEMEEKEQRILQLKAQLAKQV